MRNMMLAFALVVMGLGAQARADNGHNVILLMLDGVRYQEFFYGVDPNRTDKDSGPTFPFLWSEFAKEGVFFGDKRKGDPMYIANRMRISLPAYHSIMAGRTQDCMTNTCGRITEETIQERLVRESRIHPRQVATIASWVKIRYAAESREGATFVNAGIQPLNDRTRDDEVDRINREQARDTPPWGDARFDKYTWAHSMRYLRAHQPRFMFISLNDADEWGHRGDYRRYVATLRQYDLWIKELIETLSRAGEYGEKTTLIVTTDHGRGETSNWIDHGPLTPDAKHVWLYGRSPKTKARPRLGSVAGPYSHLDIRPTMEAALGVQPKTCEGCGVVMREIVPVPRH